MQAARQAAIKTLQQRREEKRQQAERVAQEEIVSISSLPPGLHYSSCPMHFVMQTVTEAWEIAHVHLSPTLNWKY